MGRDDRPGERQVDARSSLASVAGTVVCATALGTYAALTIWVVRAVFGVF